MHLAEFAGLQMNKYNDALARKKPCREEKQGGFVNDVDSEDENHDADKKRIYFEFLGERSESDCDEQDDTEGNLTVKRPAFTKCS